MSLRNTVISQKRSQWARTCRTIYVPRFDATAVKKPFRCGEAVAVRLVADVKDMYGTDYLLCGDV